MPLKGCLLVKAVAFDDGATKVPSAIEFTECVLLSVPTSEEFTVGGDFGDWIWTDASAVSLCVGGTGGSHHSLRERIAGSKTIPNVQDYTILRILKYAVGGEGSSQGVVLSWSSKLVATGSAGGGTRGNGLGYEWVLLLEQTLNGSIVEVSRGVCDSVDIDCVDEGIVNGEELCQRCIHGDGLRCRQQ